MSKRKKIKKQYADFAHFNEDFKGATGYIEQVFAEVAQKAGIKFVNKAKSITKDEGLVDTGNYRRNWTVDIDVDNNQYKVIGSNPIEYASYLEYGHKIKGKETKTKGYFVGTQARKEAKEYAFKTLKDQLGDLFKS